MIIALAGNPNSGKTTLFNALTGSRQKTGNWPGVTVEKKEGELENDRTVRIQDLPGIYSLSPYSPEEIITRDWLVKEKPDVILNIVDGTNLERSLYLTTQLLELDIPTVVALNMADLIQANGDQVDVQKLAERLGCPVIPISALKGEGIAQVTDTVLKQKSKPLHPDWYSAEVKKALDQIQTAFSVTPWQAVKLFERDEAVLEEVQPDRKLLESLIVPVQTVLDDVAESILTCQRYDAIARLLEGASQMSQKESFSEKADKILTNRILALPIFLLVMWGIYTIAMGGTPISIGTMGTDWMNDVFFGEMVTGVLEQALDMIHTGPILTGLVLNGIVSGVGSVLGFVPQILVLFLLLAMLEDCGYMARAAFIMDRLFRRFGLSGKSFIPLLVATGCGVPGIMASRTIEQEKERKLTILTTGFIACGAKMPIIGLFAGAVFGGSSLVAVSAFVIGIGAVIVSGILLKKTRTFAGDPVPFVMELPAYHWPSMKTVLHSTWQRGVSFVKRAGTLILASAVLLWFLQAFGFEHGQFGPVASNNDSLLAILSKAVAWIFYPLGWTGQMAWKATVASFTGLIAKEQVVNTFGVLYGSEAEAGLWQAVAADFTAVSAYSFMVFNLLCAPCFAAMGAIRREMGDPKWTLLAIGYMCVFAYGAALIVYQLGGWLSGDIPFSFWTGVALVLAGTVVLLLCRKGYDERKETANILAVEG